MCSGRGLIGKFIDVIFISVFTGKRGEADENTDIYDADC